MAASGSFESLLLGPISSLWSSSRCKGLFVEEPKTESEVIGGCRGLSASLGAWVGDFCGRLRFTGLNVPSLSAWEGNSADGAGEGSRWCSGGDVVFRARLVGSDPPSSPLSRFLFFSAVSFLFLAASLFFLHGFSSLFYRLLFFFTAESFFFFSPVALFFLATVLFFFFSGASSWFFFTVSRFFGDIVSQCVKRNWRNRWDSRWLLLSLISDGR